ncbi:MAG: Sugar-specific transcriptional regulator TrmB [Methanoregulaceae archaeon PtaB.Bin108]|nr:MAG: Sugar-specific transcriptional regulator TrmB [Methanoregulaceae archaeon PtaB.Bin108]
MRGVIQKRREYLHLMRACTLEHGFFTITDIQRGTSVPRSTAQDWINRLLDEGCVVIRERKMGRNPAKYAAISAIPSSACRRIFTTIDGDRVEIHHDCLSSANAAFCAYHHTHAGGVIENVRRDGTLIREWAHLGHRDVDIGLHPAAAVGVAGIERDGEDLVQHIRCIGGPAYSLTDMMSHAGGVCDVSIQRSGDIVEGSVRTKALTHVIAGIDDTDNRERGATFALSLALLQHLETMKGVLPISHHVAMLNPAVTRKTAGNSCSYIEIAMPKGSYTRVKERALNFVEDESLSPEWGMAFKQGFIIPPSLRAYGERARREVITREEAEAIATEHGIEIYGGFGVVGALAAVALSGLPHEILLRAEARVPDSFPGTRRKENLSRHNPGSHGNTRSL